jgi:hypothetical protein
MGLRRGPPSIQFEQNLRTQHVDSNHVQPLVDLAQWSQCIEVRERRGATGSRERIRSLAKSYSSVRGRSPGRLHWFPYDRVRVVNAVP